MAMQVTTIDTQDHTITAGALDTYITKWDIRCAQISSKHGCIPGLPLRKDQLAYISVLGVLY